MIKWSKNSSSTSKETSEGVKPANLTDILPEPVKQVGRWGVFQLEEAMKHAKELTQLGSLPVGSDALDPGLQYVLEAAEKIKKTAHGDVDVEVELFHASSNDANSDLKHVVLKVSPKHASKEARDSAILISSHVDPVFKAEGGGDDSSSVAVMLELARGISQSAHSFKKSVIFFFNTGEEEGLNGAHSFITQTPWSSTVPVAIDLDALGIEGAASVFQLFMLDGTIEQSAVTDQDIKSDLITSGDTNTLTAKNDKPKLSEPVSLKHIGENMLAFLGHTASSSQLPKRN